MSGTSIIAQIFVPLSGTLYKYTNGPSVQVYCSIETFTEQPKSNSLHYLPCQLTDIIVCLYVLLSSEYLFSIFESVDS